MVVLWLGQKVNKIEVERLLASLNCSEIAKFKDDSAVSLAASIWKLIHFTFYKKKFTSPPLTE